MGDGTISLLEAEKEKIHRTPPFFPSRSCFREYSCSVVITIVFLTTQVLRENPANFSGSETVLQLLGCYLLQLLISEVWKLGGAGTPKFESLMP